MPPLCSAARVAILTFAARPLINHCSPFLKLHPQCTSSCGSPFTWRYNNLFEDWTIANLYGRQLVDALSRKFHGTTLHGAAGEDPAKQ